MSRRCDRKRGVSLLNLSELKGCITDVPGFYLGHAHDEVARTGVSVVLCPPGTVGACELRGTATATRGMDALRAEHLVGGVDAIVLTGGSAFGLASADGVMTFLEEQGRGFASGRFNVPTVAAGVLFDLHFGDGRIRPDAPMGRAACRAASNEEGRQGSVGAGAGATIGKLFGQERAMKGGVGTVSMNLPGGGVVGAIVAVNAFGGVYALGTGEPIAGPRAMSPEQGLVDTEAHLRTHGRPFEGFSNTSENTTLVAVATNARLTKTETHKLAQVAANGLIRTIRPSYTTVDGDMVFALSHGECEVAIDVVGAAATETVGAAICRAIMEADGGGIVPAWRDLPASE